MPVTEQTLECDLLVAGGGIAGVCCALAAARLGTRVILCQDRSVLGGNASSEVRMHIVGATGLSGGKELQNELREGGIIEELRLDLAVQNPQRSPALMDLLLYDKCRREPNMTLYLNTTVVSAVAEDGLIREVRAERPSTEDAFVIRAKTFVDCTGDGRLGIEAGAPFMRGRESKAQFGESLAQNEADSKTLGSSIMFQARKHGREMPFTAPPWARRFSAKDFKLRPYGQSGFDLGLEYGYWWIEWGGCLDTLKDNERIRDELLAITLGVWDFVKNHSDIDASHWALEWIGFVPGKRESRRFIGQHILTENDLITSRAFPDAIAYGGWPIDTHPPEGVDAPELPPCTQHHLPYIYDIPLRCCVSTGPRNLMFAGRNISATHIAFASTRVMATCAVIGQGVGTAAALALKQNVLPFDIAADSSLMYAIQQQLLKDDCHLIGLRNDDACDLVRQAAQINASSIKLGAEPENVRSGFTRIVTNVPTDRRQEGVQRWMSEEVPAWLEIRWDEPVCIREVVLIFDSGQHRLLTLSQADGYTQKMLWGQPQSETVRDYVLSLETTHGWQDVLKVAHNYQRRRSHLLEQTEHATALRIQVTATNGLDHARIVEVRAYA
ncbi:FAD-dependent oxidoreductase [Prosthecobacter sp.]|uniref:FAD-dependent oxidoreductase n=1 Tax=Prosthecobacter sp. TaxID=1965333 RepID=UPI002AB94666|nr:FAD-dependent oxidoreductase [Prosthecobacter sp.]MDZ4406038.1 FAD-dependent oxidoreductase [Prosthecobacter sp.]